MALALLVAGLLVAGPGAGAGSCPGYDDPVESGRITDPRINEVSGLVAGWTAPRMLWFHEDSGNGPWLYAIEPSGELIASIEVLDATNRDWEDMARSNGRLWIGDIGDNARVRPEIQVYWFAEPSPDADTVRADMVTLRYPDDSHNAEAMIVDGKRLFVVEKRMDPIGPDGVVVRNYASGLLYPWDGGVARTLRRADPCSIVLPTSETVAFSLSGHRVYSVPEGGDPVVSYAARRP